MESKKKASAHKTDWFFGLNGTATFFVSLVLILVVCYINNTIKNAVPTYFQHVIVNCLLNAVLALGLNFISGYLGMRSFSGSGHTPRPVCLSIQD